MSQASAAVKEWRTRTREKIIQAMGGKCCVCGYNRCTRSLATHHLEESSKDFTLGEALKTCTAWTKLVEELRKCVLVCHNCHNEIHDGMTQVPTDAPRFNEAFADIPRHHSPVVIQHGTHVAYGYHGCRCDVCRTANTERCKRWRRSKSCARTSVG